MTTPFQQFSWDSATYPLPSLTSNPTSILQLGDPALYLISQFFTNVLNDNLMPRFMDEAQACGLNSISLNNWIDGYVVAQTICFPLNPSILKITSFRFPLLNIEPDGEDFVSISFDKPQAKTRHFIMSWILPPLTAQQYNRMYPFMNIVADACYTFGYQGFDPNVSTNSIWKQANIVISQMDGVSYLPYEGFGAKNEQIYFPSMQFKFSITERNRIVWSNYETLTGMTVSASQVDGYVVSPIDFADGYVYVQPSLDTILPNSGSINGDTWCELSGSAFTSLSIQSITICNIPVISFDVKSDKLIVLQTGATFLTGQGDVVITDVSGNTYVITNGYNYD